ncbi:hypothetical protein NL676_033316 [Syzygium grande]|nr:hypothetical protein NL676_033316 [Syzygium grande]
MPCPQFAQDRFNQATKAFLLCNIRIDKVPHFHCDCSVQSVAEDGAGWSVFLHSHDMFIQLPLSKALAKRIGRHENFPENSNQHCSLCLPDGF